MTSEKAPDMATWAAEARHRIQEMRADVGHLSNDISSGNDDSKSLVYVDADFLQMARVHQAPDPQVAADWKTMVEDGHRWMSNLRHGSDAGEDQLVVAGCRLEDDIGLASPAQAG